MDQKATGVVDLEAEPVTTAASRAGSPRRSHLLGMAVTVPVLALLAGVLALRSDTAANDGSDLSGVSLPAPVAPAAADTDGFRLWFMTADGQRQVPVTDFYGEASALGAAWSPDGTRVAFHTPDGIMVINADGTDLRRVPGPAGYDPAWSPGGKRIAFSSRRYSDGGPDVYVMNADGSGVIRLGAGRRPAWSPDGSRIAFEHTAAVSGARPVYQVGVMNADGSGWGLFPTFERDGAPVTVGDPAWSPDGRWLAFHGQPTADGPRWSAIFRARPDGSHLQEVVRKEPTPAGFSAVYGPAWSPDGKWVAYSAIDGGIRLVDPQTGEDRDLAGAQRDERGRGPQDLDASWSPDGTRIAFFRFGDFHPPAP